MAISSTTVLSFNRKNRTDPELMPGFQRNSSKNLEIMYNEAHHIEVPGSILSKTTTKSEPKLATKSALNGRYIVVMLDPDAPSPRVPVLGPVLHWIQTDLCSESASFELNGGHFFPLTPENTPAVVPYLAPQPPPVATPHRYMFLLYAQPEAFSARRLMEEGTISISTVGRLRFKLSKFEETAKLGPVIAASYFLCSGST
ncbi:phosphatidylethanolamine-binding protein [Xylogone sp. PMI_703]|nr:phosphatidylethanolamine-binding protein [Xylogone sp. PMI_703]